MFLKSKLCRISMALIMILLSFFGEAKLIVDAKSAEDTTSGVLECEMEVQVVAEGNSRKKVEITHSEPKRVDGIYYTILRVDGEQAYCIQSSKDTPEEAVYEVAEELKGRDSLLNKVMYYAYGNPGYRPELWVSDCPMDEERAYLRSHIVLSYVYDPENTLKREIIDDDWEPWWRTYVADTIEKIKQEPEIPESAIAFEREYEEMYFDKTLGMQRTDTNRLIGDERNTLQFDLPEGLIFVNKTTETEMSDQAFISGGNEFYFKCDIDFSNDKNISFKNLAGTIQEDWATWVVKTGSDRQNIGYGVWLPGEEEPISLEIKFLPRPKLELVKSVDGEERIYQKGDIIPYKLEVYQSVEGAVAENIVIKDEILTEGAVIVPGSVEIYDKDGTLVEDIVLEETENRFVLSGGSLLRYMEYSENARLTILYRVLVESEEITLIQNKATVESDNAPEDEAEKEVPVEPIPEEPVPKEPAPEFPEQRVPKTGDNTGMTAFVMFMVLSGVVIWKQAKRLRGKQ